MARFTKTKCNGNQNDTDICNKKLQKTVAQKSENFLSFWKWQYDQNDDVKIFVLHDMLG